MNYLHVRGTNRVSNIGDYHNEQFKVPWTTSYGYSDGNTAVSNLEGYYREWLIYHGAEQTILYVRQGSDKNKKKMRRRDRNGRGEEELREEDKKIE